MSQYKESMDRMLNAKDIISGVTTNNGNNNNEEKVAGIIPFDAVCDTETGIGSESIEERQAKPLEDATYFFDQYKDDLLFVVGLIWVVLFATNLTRESLIGNVHMTILGVFAAVLANCVPIGGGVVYVPALAFLGKNMSLGVAFSVATMSIGNGIFGFLKWNHKNKKLILWSTFSFTVFPCWIGSIIGILYFNPHTDAQLKFGFAIFCILLAIFAAYSGYRGGVENVVELAPTSKTETSLFSSVYTHPQFTIESMHEASEFWQVTLAGVSFLGGLFLVPNIGIGPALTTYLILVLIGFNTRAAMVTGIITGGWVSVVPFLLHYFVLNDVPVDMWLMVLPGVYVGAQLAPILHELLGLQTILYLFSVFLFVTASNFLLQSH